MSGAFIGELPPRFVGTGVIEYPIKSCGECRIKKRPPHTNACAFFETSRNQPAVPLKLHVAVPLQAPSSPVPLRSFHGKRLLESFSIEGRSGFRLGRDGLVSALRPALQQLAGSLRADELRRLRHRLWEIFDCGHSITNGGACQRVIALNLHCVGPCARIFCRNCPEMFDLETYNRLDKRRQC